MFEKSFHIFFSYLDFSSKILVFNWGKFISETFEINIPFKKLKTAHLPQKTLNIRN